MVHGVITFSVPSFPDFETLDFGSVRTIAEYFPLLYLGGAPLFCNDAHIENLYTKNIRAEDGFKTWIIEFDPDAKFSDGSGLAASHWYYSIARLIRSGHGVHFNPKRDLAGGLESSDGFCEGLACKNNSVILRLNTPNRNYQRLLGRIEASILPLTAGNMNDRCHPFKTVGAGPYVFESGDEKIISLRINPNYPGHKNRISIPQLNILAVPDEEAFELRIKGEVDFIFPRTNPLAETKKKLLATSITFH